MRPFCVTVPLPARPFKHAVERVAFGWAEQGSIGFAGGRVLSAYQMVVIVGCS